MTNQRSLTTSPLLLPQPARKRKVTASSHTLYSRYAWTVLLGVISHQTQGESQSCLRGIFLHLGTALPLNHGNTSFPISALLAVPCGQPQPRPRRIYSNRGLLCIGRWAVGACDLKSSNRNVWAVEGHTSWSGGCNEGWSLVKSSQSLPAMNLATTLQLPWPEKRYATAPQTGAFVRGWYQTPSSMVFQPRRKIGCTPSYDACQHGRSEANRRSKTALFVFSILR